MNFKAHLDEKTYNVKIIEEREGYSISIDRRESFHIDIVNKESGGFSVIYKEKPFDFEVESKENIYHILLKGKFYSLELIHEKSTLTKAKETGEKKLTAQMPGKIIKIMVKVGDTVVKDQGLIIMEAMKMENELKAPGPGKIKNIFVKESQTVEAGADLLLLE